jgi:predicted amidohydrolase
MVVDPLGAVVASAADQPTLVMATVDTDRVADVRDRFRFLPDRRFSADLA